MGILPNGALKERGLDHEMEKISEVALVCPSNTVFTQLKGWCSFSSESAQHDEKKTQVVRPIALL